ncbi:MAG: transporter substrate-binding domain-containing protein [Sneathiella sp.]|nr:transporter substrate-binding domain-containing protein [Sneathiella sp.]
MSFQLNYCAIAIQRLPNMKILTCTAFLFFFVNSIAYSHQRLVLAKIESLSDQYIGQFILTEAYKHLGINLTFKTMPALRALESSRSGEVDGEIQRIPVIEKSAPNLIRVPTSINHVDLSVFFTKQIPFRSLMDFRKYSFVYVRGVMIYETLLEHFNSSYPVSTDDEMWTLINLRRMDFALAGRVSSLHKLKHLGIEGIYALAPPYKTFPLYHYLHEKHRDLVPKINMVLQTMARNGELARLREQAVRHLLSGVHHK